MNQLMSLSQSQLHMSAGHKFGRMLTIDNEWKLVKLSNGYSGIAAKHSKHNVDLKIQCYPAVGVEFVPMVVETSGAWAPEATKALKKRLPSRQRPPPAALKGDLAGAPSRLSGLCPPLERQSRPAQTG